MQILNKDNFPTENNEQIAIIDKIHKHDDNFFLNLLLQGSIELGKDFDDSGISLLINLSYYTNHCIFNDFDKEFLINGIPKYGLQTGKILDALSLSEKHFDKKSELYKCCEHFGTLDAFYKMAYAWSNDAIFGSMYTDSFKNIVSLDVFKELNLTHSDDLYAIQIKKIKELPPAYRNCITLEIEKYEFDKEQDCESILEEAKERLKYVARIEALGCKVINNHPLDEKYLGKLYRKYME